MSLRSLGVCIHRCSTMRVVGLHMDSSGSRGVASSSRHASCVLSFFLGSCRIDVSWLVSDSRRGCGRALSVLLHTPMRAWGARSGVENKVGAKPMMKLEVFVAMTVTVVVQATFGGEGDVGGCADEGDDEGGDCGAGEAEGEDA